MNSWADRLEYRRLRAPRQDGGVLVEPPWSRVDEIVAANVRLRASGGPDFFGMSLASLADEARRELLTEAARYTASYADPGWEPSREKASQCRVFLAGHQPQLFHPGVWFKNFALGRLAQRYGAVAVNLVIDSDTMKSHAVRVPGGSPEAPRASMIPLDDPGPVVPFEERSISNRALFESFGQRAMEHLAGLIDDPLLRDYWPLAVARSRRTENLGECLAQSRHCWERGWGLQTLEIPQSRVCQFRSFARFTVRLLAEMDRLAAIYNEAVREYRRIHRIRSTAHPVPDLAVVPPWWESPYWIWTRDDPRRRRLFVSRRGRHLVLSDRQGLEFSLEFSASGDPRRAIEGILDMGRRGVKLRSRALVTTMFARLVLGDLFLHGIGGAKYDQLTDAIIQRFFGLDPPGFLVLSATILLPTPRRQVTPEEARRIQRQLRDLDYHPETFLNTAACAGRDCEAAALVAAKKRWIDTPPTAENARTRWREIRRINAALQPWVAERREALLRERAAVAAALAAESVLAWREYAFCLYPGPFLRDALASLLPSSSAE
jgi:hypothetical protein